MEDDDYRSNMPKLILIAVILLAILVVVILKRSVFTDHPSLSLPNLTKPGVKTISFNLDLTNPDDNSLLFDSSILLSGKTAPDAAVIIDDNGSNSEVDADKNGDFSENIDLDSGLNNITVTAFNDSGDSKSVTRTVFYSQDKLQ